MKPDDENNQKLPPDPAHPGSGENSETETNEADGEFEAHWARLKKFHEAAGEGFVNSVLAGIEVVRLKLDLPHGKFAKAAAEMAGDISPRTVTHYRQLGERYLSAAHGCVMTVRQLRKNKERPQDELCSEERASRFLAEHKIRSADDLKTVAEKDVPDLTKRRNTPSASRVDNIFRKLRRAWSRMNDQQREEFNSRFNELRRKPATSAETASDASAP